MASLIVIVTVLVSDIFSFSLAIAAEKRKTQSFIWKDSIYGYYYCTYNSNVSTGMGVGALLFLLASQVIIMVASKCFCCGRSVKSGGSRICTIVLLISCWVTFIIAEVCLIAASVGNAHRPGLAVLKGDYAMCENLRKGVFGAGATFIFITAILSVLYYVFYSKAQDSVGSGGAESGMNMGPYH